ncbi:uncharacterized protein ASCRUDRAFT_104173 [Ascoidea rubescens DSM 1968]|uniref:Uncharacterized protein n=1 Tax=Ascoidea rubescens DSM 1968 TaxID=1344418 RepID=A0A1D2VRT3_9ASCO|nr:hypothetical protein ASCRUDRAFT_104173 [Ascoidea rubescens DSM 1968]ODV64287.1 hypothetical protein ASCRUDRAFT_104173 [Ascoidea rubescens DSM 1968]
MASSRSSKTQQTEKKQGSSRSSRSSNVVTAKQLVSEELVFVSDLRKPQILLGGRAMGVGLSCFCCFVASGAYSWWLQTEETSY